MEGTDNDWVVSEMYEPEGRSIPNWSEDDRPREKMLAHGADTLSKAELIAVLIGSGSANETAVQLAQRILSACGDNLHTLSRLNASDLKAYNGMGDAKAAAIIAACELGRRRAMEDIPNNPALGTPDKVYEYMRPLMQDLNHEEGWVLLMDNSLHLKRPVKISRGGFTETAIDVRMAMKEALLAGATAFTLCHNHPSGNLVPSYDDDHLTTKIKEAGKLLRIQFLDHVIITANGYYSYREEGRL